MIPFEPGDVRRSLLRATRQGRGQTYYHTMKYADLECGANGYGGNNWIVLRYADVALMLAEAYYWSKEETLAKTWLNKVRERAGLGDWSGSDLRQGIYDERLHEFRAGGAPLAGSLLRMYDRMEMLEHFSAINSNFSLKDLLLPIPYNRTDSQSRRPLSESGIRKQLNGSGHEKILVQFFRHSCSVARVSVVERQPVRHFLKNFNRLKP